MEIRQRGRKWKRRLRRLLDLLIVDKCRIGGMIVD